MTRQDDATKPVAEAFSAPPFKSGEMLVAAHYWIAASAVLHCFLSQQSFDFFFEGDVPTLDFDIGEQRS